MINLSLERPVLFRSDKSIVRLGSPLFFEGVIILGMHSMGESAGTSSRRTPILQSASNPVLTLSLKCHGTGAATCLASEGTLGSTISWDLTSLAKVGVRKHLKQRLRIYLATISATYSPF